MHYRY